MRLTTPARFAAGALACLAVLAASSADTAVPTTKQARAHGSGGAQLMAFGGRSAAQRSSVSTAKLDAALADLSRHIDRVRTDHALEDLRSLSPAARFMQSAGSPVPLVAVDAVTRGDPARLKAALISLGMQRAVVFSNDVGGWLPVNQIEAAGALAELAAVRASMPHTRGVLVTSQGDFAQGSAALRANNAGLNGAGVTVGILSDSFNCYGVYDKPGSGVPATTPNLTGYAEFGFATDDATFDETNGYLPASVSVLEEGACMSYNPTNPNLNYFLPYADEGRAMMQIVHDVAPGAALAFYTGASTEADFATGIGALAAAGAKVIADDIGYYDEPFFQDGIIAQAVDAANAKGVAYFSAAGNDAQLSYENDNTMSAFTTPGSGANAGEMLLTFGMNGATALTSLPINLPPKAGTYAGGLSPGEFIALIVEWDEPYVTGAPNSGGATSWIDVCVSGSPTGSPSPPPPNTVVLNFDSNSYNTVTCTGANVSGVDPEQVLVVGNPASNPSPTGPGTIYLMIGLKNGSPTAPGRIKVVVADDGAGSTIGGITAQCPTQPGSASSYGIGCPTLQGHPGAAGAAALGAAFFAWTPRCGTSPATLEYFSSAGGDPILFDSSGKRLAAPQYRQKPDFVGPDGVNTSFFGFPIAGTMWSDTSSVSGCQNDTTYNNFLGTSAATPHAAAVAALMLQANPALTPAQIYGALQSTALPMPVGANPTPDYLSGHGFIQADAALAALPPGPPTLTLATSTVTAGDSTTLTWSAFNVTSCTASGSWSGTQKTSGSLTITPTAAGSDSYTLTCSNPHGSAQKTATLTVQSAPAGGGGGGGGVDALTLLALTTLGLARVLQRAQRAAARR